MDLGIRSTRMMRTRFFGLALVATASLLGCSVAKYVAPEKPIYTGAKVVLDNPESVPDKAALSTALEGLINVDATNERKAYWWFRFQTDKEKGLKKRLRDALGQPPVYYEDAPLSRTQLVMSDYLKDHGYFGAEVTVDTLRPKPYTVSAEFHVTTQGRSTIDSFLLPVDSLPITQFISERSATSLIKVGDYYSIAALAAERVRIDHLAGNQGYFEFAPSNVYYFVDSTSGPNQVRVYMQLDKGADSLALERFHIGETYVFPRFSIGDTLGSGGDTLLVDSIHLIVPPNLDIHPETVVRRIGLRKGELYDRHIYENTVNQLLDLGIYKFVNYRFERRLTDTTPVLDQFIYLTPTLSRDVNVDVEATSQGGSQLGLGATVRYSDRNLFGGAEDFRISLGASAGPQPLLTDPTQTVLGQEYSFSTSIALPRLIGPVARRFEREAYYIPRTVANVRYQVTNRPDFQLQNANLRLGYLYRASKLLSHGLYPVNLSYTALLGQSNDFDSLLMVNPRLRETFASNAIAGLEYTVNYNEQGTEATRSYWYIDGGLKTSGNVAALLAQKPEDGGPLQFGGVALAQFTKANVDARRTWLYDKSSFATRGYIGAAIPHGRSDYIPFVEQFFAGGPNSVRAFPIRGLGPGRQLPPSVDSTNVNQSGDIRLELNAEYRFDVFSFIEGAAFVDVGNVWLSNDVSGEEQDAVFEFDDFYEELAVGTGIGLRLNFDVIILRLDAAVPIRKPWLPTKEAFDFKTLNLIDADNRKNNLQLHIAIGYPF